MFSIQFIEEPHYDEDGFWFHPGLLMMGDWPEGFCANLRDWNKECYEAHWLRELKALVNGAERAVLLVNYADPQKSHVESWILYREGENVSLQNRIFFAGTLPAESVPESVSNFAGDREKVTEDGQNISEWTVPLCEIAQFLARSPKS